MTVTAQGPSALPRGAVSAWLADCLGPGWTLAGTRLLNGRSSEIYALTVARGTLRREVVLRRHNRPEWFSRRPDLVEYEAGALEAVADCGLPVPRLLGTDPAGEHCGAPAVLTSLLPGQTRSVLRRTADVDELADLLHRLHRVPVPPSIRAYEPWYDTSGLNPPPWSRYPHAWAKAFEAVAAGAPDEPAVLLHRDFHLQNVLWNAGGVSGVVDWIEASTGPCGADLGHCRRNLAQDQGFDVAERLLRSYGTDLHPYWDLVTAADLIHDHPGHVDPRLDEFVARAAARF